MIHLTSKEGIVDPYQGSFGGGEESASNVQLHDFGGGKVVAVPALLPVVRTPESGSMVSHDLVIYKKSM